MISRLGISAGAGRDVLLVVDIAGSTGFQPGSAGYIRILNPEWRIVGVVAGDPRLNTDYAGFGVRIDPDQGYVEWYGRGGCPACACHENGMNFVLLISKDPDRWANYVEIGSSLHERETGGPDIEASVTACLLYTSPSPRD